MMTVMRQRWLRWRILRANRAVVRSQLRLASSMRHAAAVTIATNSAWQALDYPEPTGPDPGVPENRSEPLCPDGHDWMQIGYTPAGSLLRYCVRCGRQEHTTPPTV